MPPRKKHAPPRRTPVRNEEHDEHQEHKEHAATGQPASVPAPDPTPTAPAPPPADPPPAPPLDPSAVRPIGSI